MSSLAEEIVSGSSVRALRALWRSPSPRGIRETAELCRLSPRGASLVLQRLVRTGLVVKNETGRRGAYRVALTDPDLRLLEALVTEAEKDSLRRRSEELSSRASRSNRWIDGTLKEVRALKRRSRGAV